jgi:hypothetical protein
MSGMFGETRSLMGSEFGDTPTRSDRGVPMIDDEAIEYPGARSAYGQAVLRGEAGHSGDIFPIPDTDEPVEQPPREDA